LKAWKRAFSGWSTNPKAQAAWAEYAVSNSKQVLWYGVLILAAKVHLHWLEIAVSEKV
jgi:hypothetical protein